MNTFNRKGSALVLTLMVVVVLLIVGSSFILRAVNDWYTAMREQRSAQAFSLAEASAALGIEKIDELINTYMLQKINATNPSTVAKKAKEYVVAKDGLGFLTLFVKDGSTALLTSSGVYTKSTTTMSPGNYAFTIYIAEKADPYTVDTDVWEFPFNYEIRAQGKVATTLAKASLFGDFTVRVQRDNFARYALFTDHHGMPSGSTVWFTNNTHFTGPLHTNTQYSFAGAPSFDGAVAQHETKAEFYNNGFSFTDTADSNPPVDVPVFNSTYKRGVSEIVLSSSVQQADLYTQARGSDSVTDNGIYVANNGTSVTAGIYIRGNSDIDLGTDVNGNAQYTIIQGATTKVITVDRTNNQTSILSGGTTTTYAGLPEGVDGVGTIIYADGSINSLEGTVQKDTELTISAQTDIVITDNLVYQ